MGKPLKIKVGEKFRPAPQLRSLYYFYFLLIILVAILPLYMPVLAFAPCIVGTGLSVIIVPVLIFTLYWIPKYYHTIIYKLTKDEIEWRRGVWFKQTGIVPYNRITNIDISQGPISRMYGIASLKIQTAGYSGQSGRSAEIKIEGIEEFEELRELIMSFVRSRKPVAVETYEEGDTDVKILKELSKIRKLLEKSRK